MSGIVDQALKALPLASLNPTFCENLQQHFKTVSSKLTAPYPLSEIRTSNNLVPLPNNHAVFQVVSKVAGKQIEGKSTCFTTNTDKFIISIYILLTPRSTRLQSIHLSPPIWANRCWFSDIISTIWQHDFSQSFHGPADTFVEMFWFRVLRQCSFGSGSYTGDE